MTRTDFKAISEIVRIYKVSQTFDEKEFREFIEKLCTHFRQSNPTFSRADFLRKCGWYNA